MSVPHPDLELQVQNFAESVSTRVLMCLEGSPRPLRPLSDEPFQDELVAAFHDGRYTFNYRQSLHAERDGDAIGMLELDYALGFDRLGRHLAVQGSSFKLKDRRGKKPILRVEYLRDARDVPCSHVHVHAESGLFTELLAATGHKSAASVASIHIPTGGDRFRPCVEDFIQFLIVECRIAARDGWREEVEAAREEYRRIQTAAP